MAVAIKKQTAAQIASHNVSRNQSERLKTINEKAEEWVDKDSKSGMLVFAWTGRCQIDDALVRFYGTHFASLSPRIIGKLSEFIKSLADSSHPKFQEAVNLLEMGVNNDNVQLEEDSATGFIKHLVEKQIILPLQAPMVTAAWTEYQSEMQPRKKSKHGRKKHKNISQSPAGAGEDTALNDQAEAEGPPNAARGGLGGGVGGRGLIF